MRPAAEILSWATMIIIAKWLLKTKLIKIDIGQFKLS